MGARGRALSPSTQKGDVDQSVRSSPCHGEGCGFEPRRPRIEQLTYLKAILLGVVQGLTEFLPVSSSGHLVLFQHFFGLGRADQALAFDVALHFGTLLAVIFAYRKDLWEMATGASFRLALLIGLATIPAVIVGLTFKSVIEEMFVSPREAAIELMITGVVLWLTRGLGKPDVKTRPPSAGSALAIGTAQAVAILPGISRSGMTIAAGLFCRFDRETAARFSFLMSIPAIAGACLLEAKNLAGFESSLWPPVLLGTIVSAITGFLSIRWLLGVIRRGRLHFFAYYCWAAGLLALLALSIF